MKIGGTADWHVGSGTMDGDIESSVLQTVDIFRKEKVDFIAIPGDFFDHKSTAEGRNLLRKLMQAMCSVAPVVGCYGNHDQPGDLDIFAHLEVKHPIYIHSTPQLLSTSDQNGNQYLLHILPWFTKASWQSHHIGVSKEVGDATVSQMALQYVKNNIAIYNDKNSSTKHILISHLLIAGAKAQNHQPLIGEGINFGITDLIESGLSGGIFGHIHLGQPFGELGTFCYPGSPAAMNYGEDPEKYCTILDTEMNCTYWHRLKTIDRFSVECIWPIGVTMSVEEFQTMKERARGARVRVLLKVEEGDNLARAKEEIEKILMEAGALEVKVDPQTRPKDLVRAVEISQAETLEAKLEAYWEANDNRPDEAIATRLKARLAIIEQRCRA